MAVTVQQLTGDKQNKDGTTTLLNDKQKFDAGQINAGLQSFFDGLFKSAGFLNTDTFDTDTVTNKLSNPEIYTKILNQLVGSFFQCNGTNAYSLVSPNNNANFFPYKLVSNKTSFQFVVPNTNTIQDITLQIPGDNKIYPLYQTDGTKFNIGQLESKAICYVFYDETLNSGSGGFQATINKDMSVYKNPTELGEIRTFKYFTNETPPAIKTFSNGIKAYLFNGQTLTQTDAPVLFADRGWTGSVVLENRNGRVSVQMGAGYLVGTTGGKSDVVLTKANIPNYALPTIPNGTILGNNGSGPGLQGGSGTSVNYSTNISSGGSDAPFSIMQPYIVDAIYLLAW